MFYIFAVGIYCKYINMKYDEIVKQFQSNIFETLTITEVALLKNLKVLILAHLKMVGLMKFVHI